MKPSTKRGIKGRPSSKKLFLFNEKDEKMMAVAIKSSIRFMESYGKGRRPFRIVTDYRNYNQFKDN